jgi:probable rRNA maturation factor
MDRDGLPDGGRRGRPRARRPSPVRDPADPASRLRVEVVTVRTRAPGLGAWLEAIAPARARGHVTVALASDIRVRSLNRRYRRKDTATDVLSFPAGEPFALGDIVIAEGVARRQARAAGHSLQTELRVLALHGLLHLLGYDHERDSGRMARLEGRLRRRGGLRQGLLERKGAA